MRAFIWNKYFESGNSKVDNQHKKLVELVNDLGNLTIDSSFKGLTYNDIYKRLVEYTHYHFLTEENLMKESGIDKRYLNDHINKHQSFVNEVITMVEGLKSDDNGQFIDLFDYLTHWLTYHILGTDMVMIEQINLIKEGKKPEEAYDIVAENVSNTSEPLLVALKGLFMQVTKKNQKLLELNKTLEEKVFERTLELSMLNEHLENLSYTDPLTGLGNRRFIISNLIEAWKNSCSNNEELSCFMIDADNFKIINDTYGHDAGDIVLRTLADTLKNNIKDSNIVGRLGGDEFLAILPGFNCIQASKFAETLLKDINKLDVKTGSGSWKGSVSIGLSTKSADIKDYEELVKQADINVYEAKRAGRNCIK